MRTAIGVLVMLFLGTAPAWAVLGENESSVSLDQQVLRSQDSVQAFQAYKVHQLTSANGAIVREYISAEGTVFGISWQGPFVPNLQQLLGSYLTDLQQGQVTQHMRRCAITIQTDNFVFSSVGHLRFFRGRAYVPGLVPANLTPEVVQ